MAFKIKADENMPRTIVQILRERGYDAINLIEERMGGRTLNHGKPYREKNDF